MAAPHDHMKRREAEKDEALADIREVLQFVEVQRRSPDLWERVHLARAFASVFSGCYGLAATEARLALTPVNERSPAARLADDPFLGRGDLPRLMEVWHAAQAEPARQFPHFGPVIFS